MNRLKLISLFAGIGAVEFGAYRVYDEVEILAAAEIDKFARQSYIANHNINEDEFYTDVRKFNASKFLNKADCVSFGFPCQDYSIAGSRAGLEGQRGTLFYEGARIVKEVQPKFFIAENVKGLLSSNGGKDYKTIMDILRDELGYYCHCAVLNTKDYGVPQNRERIFIVGFKDVDLYHRFQFAPKIKLEKCLRDVLNSDVDEKYYLSDETIRGFISHKKKNDERGYGFGWKPTIGESVANCLDCIPDGRPNSNFTKVKGMLNIKGTDQIRRVYGVYGVAATLTTMQGGNQEPKIQVKSATKSGYEIATTGDSINLTHPDSKTRRGRVGVGVAQTLDCACNQAVVQERIRKLTPLECLRLQDFPDTFKQVVSNSQQYKQAGNSMSVNVLEMIFNQIEKAKSNEPTNTLMDFMN